MSEETVRSRPVLGIDIGGSGIKGAPVDLATGEFTTSEIDTEERGGGRRRNR
jgi:polyphosphate glucokinase